MDENTKQALQAQVVQAREQLNVLKNLLSNLFTQDFSGKRTLRPNVKEKDIQMISDAIIKIKSNYKDVLSELDIMEKREKELGERWSKGRQNFINFSKETGIDLPKFFKDYYQIDG